MREVNAMDIVFVLSTLYAVIGNAVVLLILASKNISTKFLWSGTPGYLYRVCAKEPTAGPRLRCFALSTDVAFAVCFLCVPVFFGVSGKS